MFQRRRAGSVHLDDLDLLAYASGLRLDDAAVRHIAACEACRTRQQALVAVTETFTQPLPATPSAWTAVQPRRTRRSRYWIAAGAAVLALLLLWPRMLWTAGPPGPIALVVFLRGTTDRLRPVKPVTGRVSIRFVRGIGWALLTAERLPVLPDRDVYEAWWIRGRQHVPAAVFRPDAEGRASVWMPSRSGLKGVDAVGITIEPAPGRRMPTGPRAFFSRL